MNNHKSRCYLAEFDGTTFRLHLYSKDTLHEICISQIGDAFSIALSIYANDNLNASTKRNWVTLLG